MTNYAAAMDKRHQERRAGVPFCCLYQLGIKTGRRMGQRRLCIKAPSYVDRYAGHLMLCAIGIMILSSLDAFFYLEYIG